MQQRKDHQPFYFWYGSSEPHRAYEKGSWKRNGKKLDQVDIPGFIPDSEEIRGDMLDYAVEIEWADSHLCQMINHLDSIGELNNTIIIVTADNGMPFPRAKANCFEYGIHIPMAISYPNGFPAGRRVDDLISFIDLAPTILELAGIKPEGMQPLSGKSIVNILKSEKKWTHRQEQEIRFRWTRKTFIFQMEQPWLSSAGNPWNRISVNMEYQTGTMASRRPASHE